MRSRRLAIIFQICFWSLFLLLQMVMSSNFLSFKASLLFSVVNLILATTVFYMNGLWLFPAFFEKKRYGLYILFNLVALVLLSHIFFRIEGQLMQNFRIIEDAPMSLPPYFQYIRIFSLLTAVNLISLIFSLIYKVRSQELTEKQLSEEKLHTEVSLLKAQINPHFIFNSLNNIYSLAYSKSEQTPEAVLKLSHMLRYVYYDCSRDEVTLGAELEYIKNYIAFQQMKSPQKQNIILESDGINESFRIAPMLFIPFVENSFKYSKIEDQQDARVEIKLATSGNELFFKITNTHPENGLSSGSGMGIENVRSRLALTYPGKHELKVRDENNTFEVVMKIDRS
jgi:two-component system LytT family sensor kinase